MAELTTVARPYAEATFRAAVEANSAIEFRDALRALGIAAANSEMTSMLGNPKVSTAEKSDVLAAIAGGSMAPALGNLIKALLENGKAALLPYISEHFERLQREHDGVVKATITSAFPMTAAETTSLVDALAKKYGKKIEVEVKVDPTLIGGARVQVGDNVLHASVRDALDQMKRALIA